MPTAAPLRGGFTRARPELYAAIADLDHVLALSRVGDALLPVRVPTGPVNSETTVVFALEDFASRAVRARDHAEIDLAVHDAYGWHDLDLKIGHHPTKIGTRWTVSPDARFEILDRLLVENHRRAARQR